LAALLKVGYTVTVNIFWIVGARYLNSPGTAFGYVARERVIPSEGFRYFRAFGLWGNKRNLGVGPTLLICSQGFQDPSGYRSGSLATEARFFHDDSYDVPGVVSGGPGDKYR
jgi:hypothetical protein